MFVITENIMKRLVEHALP